MRPVGTSMSTTTRWMSLRTILQINLRLQLHTIHSDPFLRKWDGTSKYPMAPILRIPCTMDTSTHSRNPMSSNPILSLNNKPPSSPSSPSSLRASISLGLSLGLPDNNNSSSSSRRGNSSHRSSSNSRDSSHRLSNSSNSSLELSSPSLNLGSSLSSPSTNSHLRWHRNSSRRRMLVSHL